MREHARALRWAVVALLCCTTTRQVTDPRPARAQALFDEATRLQRAGHYLQAIPGAEQALAIREAALGKDHLAVAQSLHLLATLDRLQGLYGRAEPLFQRALAIREAVLGKDHPDVAQSLYGLALVYEKQRLPERAEPLFQRALAIREAALGKDHLDVAQSLDHLADRAHQQLQYEQAERLFQRALAIREAALGKDHPDVARSLDHLAWLYGSQNMRGRAEQLFQRALAIREAALGRDHPDVAESLDGLAVVLDAPGSYSRVEPLLERALAIREAALGKDHPDVGESLNNLGMYYCSHGMYGRGEPLLRRSLVIFETALGKHHQLVAVVLNNLAFVYREQGLYSQAEPLFQKALTIREAMPSGDDHSIGQALRISQALSNLGNLYREQGLYSQAEPLLERALAVREKLVRNQAGAAITLDHLAELFRDQGQYDRAEPLFERSLAIREATLGKDDPAVAQSLNNLAGLSMDRGLDGRAEPLFERALTIEEAALGKNHPEVARSLNGLGQIRLRQRRLAEATACFIRALDISEARLRQESLDFSESRLSSFLHLLDEDARRLYSLARAHPGEADVRRLALASALLLKGRSVEEAAGTSRAVLQSLGPPDRDAFDRLRGLRTQLAKLSLDGPGNQSAAEYRQKLKALADEGDAVEADLAGRSASLRALAELPSAANVLERVASALPADGALVELVDYKDTQPRLLALVLFPDGRTAAVDLGPTDTIDQAASELREAFASQGADFEAAAQRLYRLAFQPLRQTLRNTRKVFLAPDGQLSLVPFEALHDGRGFLADAFDFTYLTGGRDLLPHPGGVRDSSSVVVLADPDYGASAPAGEARAERSSSVERFFAERGAGLSGQRWAPLAGTRDEAQAIRRLLPQAQVYLGAEATKDRLLRLSAPSILHIATHGFFLEDATAPAGTRGLAEVGASMPRLQDPLLRSGLVLAGATGSGDLSNSLVTALELMGLNLWGTQLVVLSACDTGRGEVKRGQGVYGLRRAFAVAGAETLVVSLWKIDDETTRAIMEHYYRNLLAGRGRVAALHQAMLALRRQYPHPHFWAPFIAIGSDAPLRLQPRATFTAPHLQ